MREDMAKVIVTPPRVLDSLIRKGRRSSPRRWPNLGICSRARYRERLFSFFTADLLFGLLDKLKIYSMYDRFASRRSRAGVI